MGISKISQQSSKDLSINLKDTSFISNLEEPSPPSQNSSLQRKNRASHNEIPIIFDSGASIGVLPKKTDFISLDENEETGRHHKLSDLTLVNAVRGVGTVRWLVYTENGFARHIEQVLTMFPQPVYAFLACITIVAFLKIKGADFAAMQMV
jgi:hypothetical protein